MKSLLSGDFVTRDSFVSFVSSCSRMEPALCTRFTPKADNLSVEVIGAVIEVHRIMGPGLLESIYEPCRVRELELLGIPVHSQQKTPMGADEMTELRKDKNQDS